MQHAIIYTPSKTSMQSGTAKTGYWVLEFKQELTKKNDPLMGWVGGTRTQTQVSLTFDTLEQATHYADSHEIAYTIRKAKKPRALKIKSYADNYAYNRRETWTH